MMDIKTALDILRKETKCMSTPDCTGMLCKHCDAYATHKQLFAALQFAIESLDEKIKEEDDLK